MASGLSLSEQNRLRLLELATSLKSSLPQDSQDVTTIDLSIAALARAPLNRQESVESESGYIPSCFKDDIDLLRQAEGAAWTDQDIRLLSDSLKEVGVSVTPDLKAFIA